MTQASHPTLINLPPPGSQPETPSEMPGTPTSATTSLSALSTTAIKDGHRGHLPQNPLSRGHNHTASTTSLEAERADRISRLAGLERVSTLRAPPQQSQSVGGASPSPQTTPTSTTGFPTNFPSNFPSNQPLTPAYFDSNGQPMAVTKMSTVGTASATESHVGEGDDARTTAGERDEDILSMDTNYREAGSVTSMGADPDAMDEDIEGLGARSVGGYEDRMSDDGSASLVGFGEGAGSTVSGPIYHRKPLPGTTTAAQQAWILERSNSNLSDARSRDRDTPMATAAGGGGGDTPMSVQERRDSRPMDGVAMESDQTLPSEFTARGDVQQHYPSQSQPTEMAEGILQRLDSGEKRAGPNTLGTPSQASELGKFYFEDGKER